MRTIHSGTAECTTTEMNKCANPKKKVIGFQIARVVQFAVDIPTVSILGAAECPDSRKKGSQTFVLDVKSIQPLAATPDVSAARFAP